MTTIVASHITESTIYTPQELKLFKNPVCVTKVKMSTDYEVWFAQKRKWLIFFLTVAFSGHAGLGMALAIFGPTQPYLGRQTGVSVDTVNYIWTAR